MNPLHARNNITHLRNKWKGMCQNKTTAPGSLGPAVSQYFKNRPVGWVI